MRNKEIRSKVKYRWRSKSLKTQIFALKSEPQVDYINLKTWIKIDIERYCMGEEYGNGNFTAQGQSAVGIKLHMKDISIL